MNADQLVTTMSASDDILVTGGIDGTFKVWNQKTGRLELTCNKHEERIMAVSVEGLNLITACPDLLLVWELRRKPATKKFMSQNSIERGENSPRKKINLEKVSQAPLRTQSDVETTDLESYSEF
jgi:WD40 repeat protein